MILTKTVAFCKLLIKTGRLKRYLAEFIIKIIISIVHSTYGLVPINYLTIVYLGIS